SVARFLTDVVPPARLPVSVNVPALTSVPPVCWLVPERISVPTPSLINFPVVLAELPDQVRVVPAASTSMVPVLVSSILKLRLVLGVVVLFMATDTFAFVKFVLTYRSVPPWKSKSVAGFATDDAPMLLFVPALASVLIARMPLVRVVVP